MLPEGGIENFVEPFNGKNIPQAMCFTEERNREMEQCVQKRHKWKDPKGRATSSYVQFTEQVCIVFSHFAWAGYCSMLDEDIEWFDKEEYDRWRVCSTRKIHTYFNIDRFKRFMEFILSRPENDSDSENDNQDMTRLRDNQRLRQVLADYNQTDCRGSFMSTGYFFWLMDEEEFKDYSEYNHRVASDRQMKAFVYLANLSDCQDMIYWA